MGSISCREIAPEEWKQKYNETSNMEIREDAMMTKSKDYFAESGMGSPAIESRVALGSLIIKEKLTTTEHIRENAYLQYFIGKEEYRDEAPFDPSMMVHFVSGSICRCEYPFRTDNLRAKERETN
jgi:hypothetical protein